MILTNYHISARKSSSFFCTENVTLLQDNVQTNAQLPEVTPAAVAAVDRWDRHTDGRTNGRPTFM